MCRSEPQIPHAAILTSNSARPGRGTGISTSSAPKAGRVLAMAFICAASSGNFSHLNQYDAGRLPSKARSRPLGILLTAFYVMTMLSPSAAEKRAAAGNEVAHDQDRTVRAGGRGTVGNPGKLSL